MDLRTDPQCRKIFAFKNELCVCIMNNCCVHNMYGKLTNGYTIYFRRDRLLNYREASLQKINNHNSTIHNIIQNMIYKKYIYIQQVNLNNY